MSNDLRSLGIQVANSSQAKTSLEKGGIPNTRMFRRAIKAAEKKEAKSTMKKPKNSAAGPVDIYEQLGYCLSFFSAHTVEYELPYMTASGEMKRDTAVFMTGEHAFQASKFLDREIIQKIIYARSPKEAKEIARRHRKSYRPDWTVQAKLKSYEAIALAKAKQHEEVREALRRSLGRKIIEGSKEDAFWGTGENGHGLNHAGKAWMSVRAKFFPSR